jgi:Amidohydrolase
LPGSSQAAEVTLRGISPGLRFSPATAKTLSGPIIRFTIRSTRTVLTCPALVDFNYWLDDKSRTALKDQVELMALLSLRQPRPMYGFAAFDPLREIRRKPEDPSPLAIVQEAVMKHGFLGAKLYSPMGFKPTDNAEHGLIFPAYAALGEEGFRAALDKALDSLYSWCEANEAPILAHTTDSQSAGPEFALRAEPRFWEKVLTKYPKLKLNLAHFGNFSQAFTQTGDPWGLTARRGNIRSQPISRAAASRTSMPISAIFGGCWTGPGMQSASPPSRSSSRDILKPIPIASASRSAQIGI